MTESNITHGETSPQKDRLPLAANLCLVVLVVAVLWAGFTQYTQRVASVSLNESRFLTAEWRLLQELKVQTDRQLLEKDREIATLHRRYLELIQNSASADQTSEIRTRLSRAETERNQLLSRSISPPLAATSPEEAEAAGRLVAGNQVELVGLLQNRIEALQAQLDGSKASIGTLQAGDTAAFVRLTGSVRAAHRELELRVQAISAAQRPNLQGLSTRALVRALISTPEVRAAYPNLLETFDQYFEVYGLQERLKGELDAYTAAGALLEPIVAGDEGG